MPTEELFLEWRFLPPYIECHPTDQYLVPEGPGIVILQAELLKRGLLKGNPTWGLYCQVTQDGVERAQLLDTRLEADRKAGPMTQRALGISEFLYPIGIELTRWYDPTRGAMFLWPPTTGSTYQDPRGPIEAKPRQCAFFDEPGGSTEPDLSPHGRSLRRVFP